MPPESRDLKAMARMQLSGYWLRAIVVCFVMMLFTTVIREDNSIRSLAHQCFGGPAAYVPPVNPFSSFSSFVNLISPLPVRWGNLISFILTGPVTLGISGFFLKLIRNNNPEVGDIFSGFKYFLKSFWLNFLTTVFITLWSLLLIIPGIIAAYRYSMAYYIMADNPELTASEALTQSKYMMAGHKFELFVLQFSFLGWFILGILTFGLALLWVNPYYEATKANFYQDLRSRPLMV